MEKWIMSKSVFFRDATLFKEAVLPTLIADLMPNHMVLGLTESAANSTSSAADFVGLALEESGNWAAAALSTRPGWLCLSACPGDTLGPLLKAWLEAQGKPAHVFAPEPTATQAMKFLADYCQMNAAATQKNLAYELLRVVRPARPVHGSMRMASEGDLSYLHLWEEGFLVDCQVPDATLPDLREYCMQTVKKLVENRSVAIWDDAHGTPVSMCRKTRESSFGITVSGVYTPDAYRGKGYASHLVAAFSQKLLDAGSPRCLLFTDAENPTSNAIYQRIGYRYCGDFRRADY
jgi:uncharacterized protein